jgi:hypothetical protein
MTEEQENIEQREDSDAPYDCEETVVDYSLLDDELQGESPEAIEPGEEPEDLATRSKREEVEIRFARYERNFRSRRIRELTLTPYVKKSKRGRPRKLAL